MRSAERGGRSESERKSKDQSSCEHGEQPSCGHGEQPSCEHGEQPLFRFVNSSRPIPSLFTPCLCAELPPAALSLSPSLIATTPIPTESSLLSLWKKAAQDANKSASSGTLIASTATLSNPVLCSHTVAAEASLHFSTPSIVAPSTASASSSSFPFDKRLLLQTLQQSCPLDFLRKHGLNGSEKLILKKRNRAALEAADADWRATKQPKVDPTLQSGNLGAGQPVADQVS